MTSVYSLSGWSFHLTKTGKAFAISPEEQDVLDLIKPPMKKKISHHELVQLISESKARKCINDIIRIKKNQLNDLVVARRDIEERVLIDFDIEEKKEQVKYYEKFLTTLSNRTNAMTETEIIYVKAIPMDQFIEFGRDGKANCPWHEDKTPSLHWYKKNNTVYCFGCEKGGDTIAVIRKLHGLSFIDAVKHGLHIT